MINYVVGFLFNDEQDKVVLIHKRHGPKCVITRWNGVGGKVEDDESPLQAIVREFEEETGVVTSIGQWDHFCTLLSGVAVVRFYYMMDSEKLARVRTTTDEEVRIFDIDELPQVMENLKWMIPYLVDPLIEHDLGSVVMKKDQEI
jgi:8-oxo-dGTP diphosphatase